MPEEEERERVELTVDSTKSVGEVVATLVADLAAAKAPEMYSLWGVAGSAGTLLSKWACVLLTSFVGLLPIDTAAKMSEIDRTGLVLRRRQYKAEGT